MAPFDVLIVGGGPAGSACAWSLRAQGCNVAILDKAWFPRDKTCGGWITPQVLSLLRIDPSDYARGRTLQPITGFRAGMIAGPAAQANFATTVSYGIRRCEFDHYLVTRSGAAVFQGVDVRSLERDGDLWVVNRDFRARYLVGAGGHFCPVARRLGARTASEKAVIAQEAEYPLDPSAAASCRVRGEVPEIFFCRDMRGYGWCFRKGDLLNVGLGRLDRNHLAAHMAGFFEFLHATRVVPPPLRNAIRGSAYLLSRTSTRKLAANGALLIGDAAGLAYSQSGEGIRPAIESGLLASDCIAAAARERGATPEDYSALISARFRNSPTDWATGIGGRLPPRALEILARAAMRMPWFVRSVVVRNWFLHSGESEPTAGCAS